MDLKETAVGIAFRITFRWSAWDMIVELREGSSHTQFRTFAKR